MAYGLKYKSEVITRGTDTYQLLVYAQDYAGASLFIGDLQGIRLSVQGADGAIDAPIVKTSLVFTMADSRDKERPGYKYGGWEEFYTPNAVQYKVVLMHDGYIEWSGFVTPDSWSDDLSYRSSVSIIARDNIGHMADFEFSEYPVTSETISIRNLILDGFNLAGVAMTPSWKEDVVLNAPDGSRVFSWCIPVDTFKDMTWYEAVEAALDSAGLCMRWNGSNQIAISSVRNLTNLYSGIAEANFINRSGHRELSPAYKQIIEKAEYDAVEGIIYDWQLGDFTTVPIGTQGFRAYILSRKEGWSQMEYQHEVVRPGVLNDDINWFGDIDALDKYLLLAAVPTDDSMTFPFCNPDNYIQLSKTAGTSTMMTLSFELAHTYETAFARFCKRFPSGSLTYAIIWSKDAGGYMSFVEGEWVDGIESNVKTVEEDEEYSMVTFKGFSQADSLTVSESFITPDDPGRLLLRVYPFRHGVYSQVGSNKTPLQSNAGVRFGNININVEESSVPDYIKTTTRYDMLQNMTVKRSPKIATLPTTYKTLGTILNGFYTPSGASISNVYWRGSSSSSALPLSVYNALQYLYLHAKPNNVLSGTLRDASGGSRPFSKVWVYAGRTFILQSGDLDYLTGFVDSAVLREYDTYEQAIGIVTADKYSLELGGNNVQGQSTKSSINAAMTQGGASGGGGSVKLVEAVGEGGLHVSGSPITSSGKFTIGPDGLHVIPSKVNWEFLIDYTHGHTNKEVLDSITKAKVDAWQTAAGDAHTHANKELLDNITQDDINNWDSAVEFDDYVSRLNGGTFLEQVTFSKGLKIPKDKALMLGDAELMLKEVNGVFTLYIRGKAREDGTRPTINIELTGNLNTTGDISQEERA